MDKKSTLSSPDWVRCQAKSRPDRYYMFNKKTGETEWCPDAGMSTAEQTVLAKNIKTPAQDRLKRLQSNLKKKKVSDADADKPRSQPKKAEILQKSISTKKTFIEAVVLQSPNESKNTTSPTSLKRKSTTAAQSEQKFTPKKSFLIPTGENNGADPNIIKAATNTAKSSKEIPNKVLEKSTGLGIKPSPLQTTCGSSEPGQCTKDSVPTQLPCSPKSIKITRSEKGQSKLVQGDETNVTEKHLPREETAKNTRVSVQYDVNDNEKLLKEEAKPSIVSKIKDIYNKLVNRTAKPKKRNYQEKQEKEKQTSLLSQSKPSFKSKKLARANVVRVVFHENANESSQKQLPSLPHKHLPNSLNATLPIPVPNESANSRLQRLRNSLHLQQTALNSSANASSVSSRLFLPSEDLNVSSSTWSPSASTSECEPMDWQPINEESVVNKSISSSAVSNVPLDSSIVSEHYDMVNENLLRLAAEKKRNKKWQTNHFYIVVDTNVFLKNITFIDELTLMKLCDTMGTVIYVPYCVLQELDKLKIRSPSESVKTRSGRAIKYLNKSFEEKHQLIQAQSAVDETHHLVKVTSPDDSILNCCLQVKEQVENVLLLTEDVNLQNKAMCNDILVSTKSDLISKHESLN